MAISRTNTALNRPGDGTRKTFRFGFKAWSASLAMAGSLLVTSAAAQDAPLVVTSIKPLNSLVSAVMGGVGEPYLIVKGAASPHTASLKPSDAQALSDADAIFWIGPDLENFLVKSISSLGEDAEVVALWDAEGVEKLRGRTGGMFEEEGESHHHGAAADPDRAKDDDHQDHDHDAGRSDAADHDHAADAHDDHDHDASAQAADHHDDDHEADHAADAHHHSPDGINEHVWLDPENAVAMTQAIAATLEKVDPSNAETYRSNAEAYVARLRTLEDEVQAEIDAAGDPTFIVFHDAYQYFENRFGISAAGSITINPERAPGAARLREIKSKLESLDAACVFAEPEFEPQVVDVIIEGTNAKKGVLDPLGADLADGPDLYPTLIKNIADGIASCAAGD